MNNYDTISQKKKEEHYDNLAYNHDEEIDLIDYFLVLWKLKTYILLGAVLPAVCIAAVLA